jgi:hypothetical protein
MSDSHTPEKGLACRLWGCDGSPFCHRCGTDLYDADYVQIGCLEPLQRLYRNVRWYLVTKRKVCCKQMSLGVHCCLTKGHKGECDDIPF